MKNNCTIIGSSASNLGALLMLDETLINFKINFIHFIFVFRLKGTKK